MTAVALPSSIATFLPARTSVEISNGDSAITFGTPARDVVAAARSLNAETARAFIPEPLKETAHGLLIAYMDSAFEGFPTAPVTVNFFRLPNQTISTAIDDSSPIGRSLIANAFAAAFSLEGCELYAPLTMTLRAAPQPDGKRITFQAAFFPYDQHQSGNRPLHFITADVK